MSNLVLIYTTFSDIEEARVISTELLRDKLVICVNIFPEVSSLYLWEDKIHNSYEVVTIMKSRNDQVDKVVENIEKRHRYDNPVVSVLPIERANAFLTNWANNTIGV